MSELQAALAGAVGHRLHAAVVLVAGAVEDHPGDPRFLGAARDLLADLGRLLRLLPLELGVRHRHQRALRDVVHQLRVDVLEGAEHHEARTLACARDLLPDAQMAAEPLLGARLRDTHLRHLLAPRLAGLAANLLALVLDPLALVGLGRTQVAQLGRDLPYDLLVRPLDHHRRGVRRRELDPFWRAVLDRVREAERQLEPERPDLRLEPDAGDLELLAVARRHPLDHVRDQGAREPVQRAVGRLVRRTLDDHRVPVQADLHLGVQGARELAARPLHLDRVAVDRDRDALGHRDGPPADTRHRWRLPYQTRQRSSPPVRAWRACRSLISPRDVLRIAMPSPLRTRGISATPTYLRRPGAETRLSSRITGWPPWAYLRTTRRILRPSSVSSRR